MDLESSLNKPLLVIVVVFLVVSTVVLCVIAFDRPRITAVNTEWGTVTEDRTEIVTQLAIENPRILGIIELFVDVEYSVSLNTVEIARGEKQSIQPSGKQNVVTVSTWANNDDIPKWWVTHINNNQTTTVRVNTDVVLTHDDLRVPLNSWTRTRTVRTNILEPLQNNETRTLRTFDQPLFIVNRTAAHWGQATARQTPLIASATITNPLPNAVPILNIGYTIRMNDIRVGSDVVDQRTDIPPGSTRTIETRAIINNTRLDEWWVTHLQRNETTQLTVDFYATIEYNGVQRRIPLDFLTYQRTIHTQLFSKNNSTERGRDSISDLPRTPAHLFPSDRRRFLMENPSERLQRNR
ncbi:LEA type 2 family protein [Halocatena marina]|uniref:LEA type 2 family protein n=1 Tax=Halocatena marina TaxID=2934937 RepID=A0ABD5YJ48_9EURY|nr:LEA type 2 family protein [Halocatena marina]